MKIKEAAADFSRQEAGRRDRRLEAPEEPRTCMFDPTADCGYKAMRVFFTLKGNVPRQV